MMRNTFAKLFFCGAVLLVNDGPAQDRAPVASLISRAARSMPES